MAYARLEFVYDAEYLAVVLLAALRLILRTQNASYGYFFRSPLLCTSLYSEASVSR